MKNDINKVFKVGYLGLEMASLLVAFVVAHMLRGVSFASTEHDKVFLYFGAVFWLVISSFIKCRKIHFTAFHRIYSIGKASAIFALLISLMAFFFKEADYSRLVVFYFVLLHALFVLLLHILGDSYVIAAHRKKHLLRKTCLLGAGTEKIKQELEQHPELGMLPMCCCSIDMIEDLGQMKSCFLEKEINEVVVSCSYGQMEALDDLVQMCDPMGIRLTIIPQYSGLIHSTLAPTQFLSHPALRVRDLPLDSYSSKVAKRVFDMVFSAAVLVFLSPLFLIMAVLIKLSSKGPVFFKQSRTGYSQQEFMMYKFRSMRVTAQADTLQATKDDPRKTWIGEFMRRTNIDELPQFINVLKGEMSVIGPRPHMLVHTEEFSSVAENYLIRHYVKPGVTGWAQVNGWRGPTDTEEKIRGRVEHDLWYVENWSFGLDLKIVLMTVFGSKTRENAF